MNYVWHYDKLVETRKQRKWESGLEIHHIVPKSLGGNDNEDNLVNFTPREHFLAHWLLWKIHKNRQMSFAFFSMCQYRKRERKNFWVSSRAYEEARLSRSMTGVSEETKLRMSLAKRGKTYSEEAKLNMSLAKKGTVPWNKGKKGVSQSTSEIMSKKAQKRRRRDQIFFKKALDTDIKLTEKQKSILTMYLSGKNLNEITSEMRIKSYEINNCMRSISSKLKKL
jgi:hypothetical protein